VIADGFWSLPNAAEMQALDRHTIDSLGVPGEVLMEVAGCAVAVRVCELLDRRDERIDIICGLGNNGGDGFVAARHLALWGYAPRIVVHGDSTRLRGEAADNLARARAVGVPIELDGWRPPHGAVVVDALFGTGLNRDLDGAAVAIVEEINGAAAAGARVISVDVPSGIDADSGRVLGAAVEAAVTVTIGLPKLGLALDPGRRLAGEVSVARIGIADEAPDVELAAGLWSRKACAGQLPLRPTDGHKGTFGHVLVVAGSRGKTGAAHLAALGAARSGCGLVTVACPAGLEAILEVKTTEAMTVGVPDTEDQSFAAIAVERILELASARDVVALGPGVGQHPECTALMREVAKRFDGPMVIDADGLNAFAQEPGAIEMLKARGGSTILTPHPGEAARLLDTTPAQVNSDRVNAARSLARRSGSLVLLKGASSIVARPDGLVLVNPTGGPALATGGTGDVLTGLIAGFLAQGCSGWRAAGLAAWIHGDAADRIALRSGSSGMLAGDLADEIPLTCRALTQYAAEHEDASAAPQATILLPFPGS